MDPYLEKPTLWPDVHVELISTTRAALSAQLPPAYFVRIGERVYLSTEDDPGRTVLLPDVQVAARKADGPPARAIAGTGGIEVTEPLVVETLGVEEIRQPFLEIVDQESHQVVTVIEILSPDNKVSRSGGLKSFRKKRTAITSSHSHWVEIDLLRRGVSLALRKRIRPHEYFVHVSPVDRRPDGLVWLIRLCQRLPVVSIPLRPADGDAALDLQVVLNTAYDRAHYDRTIDYTAEPVPRLNRTWTEWAHQLLAEKGLRPA
jgi:hypothetical protein